MPATLGFLAVVPCASAGTLDLRWVQPAGSAPVTAYRVYQGPGAGDGQLVFEGLPAAERGVYAARVAVPEVAPGTALHLWVTAVGPGGESGPSRAIVLGEPPPPVGAPGAVRFFVE